MALCIRISRAFTAALSGPTLHRTVFRSNRNGATGLNSSRFRGGTLWRPAAFTLVVGATSYAVAGVWREESRDRSLRRYWREQSQTEDGVYAGAVAQVKRWWRGLKDADRFCLTMVAVNTSVFLMWRLKRFHPLMEKYFLSQVSSKSSLPLLLSEFSHVELWHLALNMLVLWSFAPALLRTLGDSQDLTSSWPYYITGGVFASMVGFYAKLLRASPLGSLGASGALMAVVALVIMNNPHSSLYIIFLPFIPIPANVALAGVVAVDVVGVLRGWQFFDHAGHLGGVLFAVLYQWWLATKTYRWQAYVSRKWRRFKSWGGSRNA